MHRTLLLLCALAFIVGVTSQTRGATSEEKSDTSQKPTDEEILNSIHIPIEKDTDTSSVETSQPSEGLHRSNGVRQSGNLHYSGHVYYGQPVHRGEPVHQSGGIRRSGGIRFSGGIHMVSPKVVYPEGQILQILTGGADISKPATNEKDSKVASKNTSSNDNGILAPDGVKRQNLLFIVGGWNSDASGWPKQMATLFHDKLVKNGQLHDCRIINMSWPGDSGAGGRIFFSAHTDPVQAAKNARRLGIQWGKAFAKGRYVRVQLIGHSAGAHMVQAISEILHTESPSTFVEITFLDPYIPPPKIVGSGVLGRYADMAENYYDSRFSKTERFFTDSVTGTILPHCHNLDVSVYDPIFNTVLKIDKSSSSTLLGKYLHDHVWPCHWYMTAVGMKEGLDRSIILHPSLIPLDTQILNIVTRQMEDAKKSTKTDEEILREVTSSITPPSQ